MSIFVIEVPTLSFLNSSPNKALSCVFNTPSPIPNMAPISSGYTGPSTPVLVLNVGATKYKHITEVKPNEK